MDYNDEHPFSPAKQLVGKKGETSLSEWGNRDYPQSANP